MARVNNTDTALKDRADSTDVQEKRHPAFCIFAKGRGAKRVCNSPDCFFYNKHCGSAIECEHYKSLKN